VLTHNYTQAELETSMMERSECLQQLHELQQTERQAAAEALKHRQNLETVLSEKKGLTDRLQLLETDNAKLSAENIQVSCPLLFAFIAWSCALVLRMSCALVLRTPPLVLCPVLHHVFVASTSGSCRVVHNEMSVNSWWAIAI